MAIKGMSRADIGASTGYYPVTPNDSADLPVETRGLIIAVGGSVSVDRLDGTNVTLTLPAGYFPLVVQRIRATGTTATGITAVV